MSDKLAHNPELVKHQKLEELNALLESIIGEIKSGVRPSPEKMNILALEIADDPEVIAALLRKSE